jgi:hypothetical protein
MKLKKSNHLFFDEKTAARNKYRLTAHWMMNDTDSLLPHKSQ